VKTLRSKLLFGLAPTLVIVLALGLWAIVMFYRLGNNIDVILRENFRSVLAAEGMKEAIERMDSGLLFAVAGDVERGRVQFNANRPRFEEQLKIEQANVTLPGEQELADTLAQSFEEYLARSRDFFGIVSAGSEARARFYFERMLPVWNRIRFAADRVLDINQANMTAMDRQARSSARLSIRLMAVAVLAALGLAIGSALWASRLILGPIEAVTAGARELAQDRLDQIVAANSNDELGALAAAFNEMARKLREYREAGTARLLRAQRTAQAAIDSFPDPIVVVDSTGSVAQVNPAARRILMVTPAIDPTVSWHPPQPLKTLLDDVLAGRGDYLPVGLEQVLSFPVDDQERYYLPRVVAIRDEADTLLGAAVALVDVTKLELLDRLKSDMVSTVSHELKTPLTSIQMAVLLLLEEAAGPLTPTQTELLLTARQDADRILSIINDLLDLARIEEGKIRLDLRRVSVRSVVEAAIARSNRSAEDAGVRLEAEIDSSVPDIMVDPARIEHVFDNLIKNAIQHSPRGGLVRIQTSPDPAGVRFAVEDEGEGIPPEDLPHVFDRFHRTSASRDLEGAGLGLAIARQIVSAHGGTVEAASQPGQGARLSFTIPAAGPAVNSHTGFLS